MKSIKEKAEEYSFIKEGIDPVGIQFREFDTKKQDGFEAGANYVLDEIEKCVKSSSNSRLKIDTIKQIIEELKK